MTEMTKDISIETVKEFWNANPLFSGEASVELATREWFESHEALVERDCLPDPKQYVLFSKGLNKSAKILDVGCGPGYWVRWFLRQGFRNVSACDLTPKAVALTSRSLELFQLKTSGVIVEGNAESLPFEDSSFDHINCQGVIHHTPNTERCVSEFWRVLRPGGTVCFSVYHKNIFLRSPLLLRIIKILFSKQIGLPGRGRENMLDAAHGADDLVRLYDGANNPIGKSYTREEVLALLTDGEKQLFTVSDVDFCFFPARAMPLPIPHWLHRWLSRNMGLLIRIRAQKKMTY